MVTLTEATGVLSATNELVDDLEATFALPDGGRKTSAVAAATMNWASIRFDGLVRSSLNPSFNGSRAWARNTAKSAAKKDISAEALFQKAQEIARGSGSRTSKRRALRRWIDEQPGFDVGKVATEAVLKLRRTKKLGETIAALELIAGGAGGAGVALIETGPVGVVLLVAAFVIGIVGGAVAIRRGVLNRRIRDIQASFEGLEEQLLQEGLPKDLRDELNRQRAVADTSTTGPPVTTRPRTQQVSEPKTAGAGLGVALLIGLGLLFAANN